MDIEAYRKQFIDEIRFEAEHDGTDSASMFIDPKSLNKLEEFSTWDEYKFIPYELNEKNLNTLIPK